jgi:hypothetical protein
MRQLQEYSRHHLFIHLLQGHDLPAKEWSNHQQNISHNFNNSKISTREMLRIFIIIMKLPLTRTTSRQDMYSRPTSTQTQNIRPFTNNHKHKVHYYSNQDSYCIL